MTNEGTELRIVVATEDHAEGAIECLHLASEPPSESPSAGGLVLEEGLAGSQQQQGSHDLIGLIRQQARPDSGVLFLVAEEAGVVEGFLVVKRFCHVSLLFVRPDRQRQGIGRRLWEYALPEIQKMVDRNTRVASSDAPISKREACVTLRSSRSAVSFYLRLGFQVIRDEKGEPAVVFKHGRWLTPMVFPMDR